MQKSQQINLYCSKNCQSISLMGDKGNHTGNHNIISYVSLNQLLEQYISSIQCPNLDIFLSQITMSIKLLKTNLDKILKNIQNQLNKVKLDLIINVNNQQKLKQWIGFIQADIKQFNKLTCADVYYVYEKVCQFVGIKQQNLDKKIFGLKERVQMDINQSMQDIYGILNKFNTKTTTNNNKIQSLRDRHNRYASTPSQESQSTKAQQMMMFGSQQQQSDKQQCRPQRRPITKKIQQNCKQEKTRKLKINQLGQIKQNQRFHIKFKVLKIIKRFKIRDQNKIEMKVGDQTGTAIFIGTQGLHVFKVDKTFDVTECRIYLFKGVIKQIQLNRNSKVTNADDIKKIGNQFDLTDGNRKKQRRCDNALEFKKKQREERQKEQRIRQQKEKQRGRGRVRGRGREREMEKVFQDFQIQNQSQFRFIYHKQNMKSQQVSSKRQQTSPKKQTPTPSKQGLSNIDDINPGDQNLSLVAQIYEILSYQHSKIICYLGDQTGLIKAQLPQSLTFLKQGISVKLTNVQTPVVNQHILLRLTKNSKVQGIHATFPLVNIANNISTIQWVEQPEQKQEQDNQSQSSQQESEQNHQQQKYQIIRSKNRIASDDFEF